MPLRTQQPPHGVVQGRLRVSSRSFAGCHSGRADEKWEMSPRWRVSSRSFAGCHSGPTNMPRVQCRHGYLFLAAHLRDATQDSTSRPPQPSRLVVSSRSFAGCHSGRKVDRCPTLLGSFLAAHLRDATQDSNALDAFLVKVAFLAAHLRDATQDQGRDGSRRRRPPAFLAAHLRDATQDCCATLGAGFFEFLAAHLRDATQDRRSGLALRSRYQVSSRSFAGCHSGQSQHPRRGNEHQLGF